jgi:hypothetical protein
MGCTQTYSSWHPDDFTSLEVEQMAEVMGENPNFKTKYGDATLMPFADMLKTVLQCYGGMAAIKNADLD